MTAMLALTGCSWLRGACADAVPVLTAAQTYATDAEIQLDNVEAALPTLGLQPSQLASATQALTVARNTLSTATLAVGDLGSACSAPDLATVFAAFVSAWRDVETALASNTLKLSPTSAKPWHTPAIVAKAGTKK